MYNGISLAGTPAFLTEYRCFCGAAVSHPTRRGVVIPFASCAAGAQVGERPMHAVLATAEGSFHFRETHEIFEILVGYQTVHANLLLSTL